MELEPTLTTISPTTVGDPVFRQYHAQRFDQRPLIRLVSPRTRVRGSHAVIGGNEQRHVLMLGQSQSHCAFHAVVDELDAARCLVVEQVHQPNRTTTLVGGILVLHPTTSTLQHQTILPCPVGSFDRDQTQPLTWMGAGRHVWLIGRVVLVVSPRYADQDCLLTGLILDPIQDKHCSFRTWLPEQTLPASRQAWSFSFHPPRWFVMTAARDRSLALDLDGLLHPRPTLASYPLRSLADLDTLAPPPLYRRTQYSDGFPAQCIRCGRDTDAGYLEIRDGPGNAMCFGLGKSTCRFCWIRCKNTRGDWRCFQPDVDGLAELCDEVVTAERDFVCPVHGTHTPPVEVPEHQIVLAKRCHEQLWVEIYHGRKL
jgi:hypothetical protein